MGLITYSKVDRDFAGGIYLPPLGSVPPLDEIKPVSSDHNNAHRLPGWDAPSPVPPANIAPGQARHLAVLHSIERAGIVVPDTGEPLAVLLQKQQKQNIKTVIANATPLEPSLNTPLAILNCYPAGVFAGLAILRQWLGADEAVMAYPHHFSIDHHTAEQWHVRCLPVSEKYPQARPASVIRTLQRQKYLPKRKHDSDFAVVFDIQLLWQIERLILGGIMPTERIVTVAGDGVAQPGHFLAPLGLSLTDLLQSAAIHDDAQCVIDGSSMAGTAIDPDKTVIAPTSQYFTVIRRLGRRRCQPCIRCGWCIDDCPAGIDPAMLAQLAKTSQLDRAVKIGLHACIECGICSYICPSHLPIMQAIRMMKQKLKPKPENT